MVGLYFIDKPSKIVNEFTRTAINCQIATISMLAQISTRHRNRFRHFIRGNGFFNSAHESGGASSRLGDAPRPATLNYPKLPLDYPKLPLGIVCVICGALQLPGAAVQL